METEPILRSAGAVSRLCKAAPAAVFRKAKKKSIFLALTMNSVQFIKTNMIQKRFKLIINFFIAQNYKF